MSVLNNSLSPEETDTLFSTFPSLFPKLEDGDKIDTVQFLEACKGVIIVVEKLGKVFAPIKYDMQGNITKITKKYNTNQIKYKYLEDIVLFEKERGENVASDALMWLRRGLHFTVKFLDSIYTDSQTNEIKDNLGHYLKLSYESTLERYHGWLGTQLSNILCRFAPTKKDFFYMLAMERDNREEYVLRDIKMFTENLSKCVLHLQQFYEIHNLETHNVV